MTRSWTVCILSLPCLLSVLPTVFLIWAFKNNNLILRNIFFYYVIFILLALCAHNFGLKFKVPDFIIKTSFDVYLIHYKILIILGGLFEIIPFWQFILFTLVATFLFYNFRNFIFKINRINLLLINRNQQWTNDTIQSIRMAWYCQRHRHYLDGDRAFINSPNRLEFYFCFPHAAILYCFGMG